VVLIYNGKAFYESDAALEIARFCQHPGNGQWFLKLCRLAGEMQFTGGLPGTVTAGLEKKKHAGFQHRKNENSFPVQDDLDF
jgi:hypothetical protein